jgi:transcriptional regulator with XRE-family HTH domain
MISLEDLNSIEDPLELFRLASAAIGEHQDAIDRLAEIRARSVAALHARGYSYKELSQILGMSAPRVGQLVGANDAIAIEIIKAWAAIEQTIADVTGSPEASYGRGFMETLEILNQSNRFDENASRDLQHLRNLRNAMAHGQAVTLEEAERITDKAVYLNALVRVVLSGLRSIDTLEEWTTTSLRRLEVLETGSGERKYDRGWWSCSYLLSWTAGDSQTRTSMPAFRRVLREVKGRETGWPVWLLPEGDDTVREAIVGDSIECWFRDSDHADFWRANPQGRMFLLRRLQEDYDFPGIEPGTFFDLILPIWQTGECLLHADRMAGRLNADNIELEMTWHGLAERELLAKAGPLSRTLMPGKISHDVEVKQRIRTTRGDISGNLPLLVKELVSPLYARFDFFEPNDEIYTSELNRMLKGA